jgi:SAM-dependent methyltransferase
VTVVTVNAQCPICEERKAFTSSDDYWSCRDEQHASECKYQTCIPRHRALAQALFSLQPREKFADLRIHESSPSPVGISLWLRQNCRGYVMSGYFPDVPFGAMVRGLRNEDLEHQTFDDGAFDFVVHLDVMEHLFDPFKALREIKRTLCPGGRCLFTAPTYPERVRSEQVAFQEAGGLRVIGKPEYHGNPQNASGSIVTWRYGYDLPYLIAKDTGFDVEVRRWYSRANAVMGPMTEVYILTRASSEGSDLS